MTKNETLINTRQQMQNDIENQRRTLFEICEIISARRDGKHIGSDLLGEAAGECQRLIRAADIELSDIADDECWIEEYEGKY